MISFSIVIDRERDVTVILAEGVPTYQDFHDFLTGPQNGQTSRAVWDFRPCSLSDLTRECLQDIAVVGRDAANRNGMPLAVALIANSVEDRLLLRLYNELSLHQVKRTRPHRLFSTIGGALSWLDRVVPPQSADGTRRPADIPDTSETFDPPADEDVSVSDMAGLI